MCVLRIDGDPPFIGGEEGGNPHLTDVGFHISKNNKISSILEERQMIMECI